MRKIKKEILQENIRPLPDELVKVKTMGNITELQYLAKRNLKCSIKRLNAEIYMLFATGEVKEFEHITNRADDKNSIRVSLSKLRDYLNTNIIDVNFCRWVTLTYSENMKDDKKLYNDFRNFNKRLREKLGHYEYIVAMEPQGRGAWHCHIVMIFDKKAPYISNDTMSDAWKQGYVTVKRLDEVDNVGAYLTAYLGDMELTEAIETGMIKDGQRVTTKDIEITDETGQKITKRYIKGARLSMYPPNFNLYRCSRGIKKPVIELTKGKTAEKKISADTLTFERTICISDDLTGFQNTINYRYYNSKRKKGQ